jgi:hypothetical protein
MNAARWLLGCLLAVGCCVDGRLLAINSLEIGRDSAGFQEIAEIPLFLSADADVQGLVMVFQWDPVKGQGVEIIASDGPGQALERADLIARRVEAGHMILGAVLDTDGITGEVIPAGQGIQIGTARIRCICKMTGVRQEIPLVFIDGTHAMIDGGPVLDNLIVIGGRSVARSPGACTQPAPDTLCTRNGTLICTDEGDDLSVTCGAPPNAMGAIPPARGAGGETVPVCFYYRSPPNGLGDRSDEIQGFSLSVSYDCQLSCIEGSLQRAGYMLEQVNAEFVEMHCDNDPLDGDGCELIAGVLIDALPPFDGRTLPPTASYRPLFCVDFRIAQGAACGSCLKVEFVDGLNGRGSVPTKNLAAIKFFEQPFNSAACQVCVIGDQSRFIRGDCNFNQTLNVADAAAIMGYLFVAKTRAFEPPCLDACDADDTGNITVTDVIFLLNYLFVPGSPVPPAPGPIAAGVDPTPDKLGCAGGGRECP